MSSRCVLIHARPRPPRDAKAVLPAAQVGDRVQVICCAGGRGACRTAGPGQVTWREASAEDPVSAGAPRGPSELCSGRRKPSPRKANEQAWCARRKLAGLHRCQLSAVPQCPAPGSPYMDSSRMSSEGSRTEFPPDRMRSYIRPVCGGVDPPSQDGHSRTAGQSCCRLQEPGLLSACR